VTKPTSPATAEHRIVGRDWRGDPIEVELTSERIHALRRLQRGADVPDVTLLPGLHDHHVHLLAAAARADSIDVGACADRAAFARTLRAAHAARPGAPLRVVGYDDTAVGPLTRADLDALVGGAPVRVQHRGGHLWVLNSAACARLRSGTDVPADGRFWDRDGDVAAGWTRDTDAAVRRVVARMAGRGTVGADDMTPTLRAEGARRLRRAVDGLLDLRVFGAVEDGGDADGVKLVVADHALPTPEELAGAIERARPARVALHCATAETLAIIIATADRLLPGDRVEHAFVTPPGAAEALASVASASVGAHPGFLRTHGDRHARHGSAADVRAYQRLRTWHGAGVRLLGGTDAPFSVEDPWVAMQAAVDRRTATGQVLGEGESLSPEEAFTLFVPGGLDDRGPRLDLEVGAPPALCGIAGRWADVRTGLADVTVLSTLRAGVWTHGRPPEA